MTPDETLGAGARRQAFDRSGWSSPEPGPETGPEPGEPESAEFERAEPESAEPEPAEPESAEPAFSVVAGNPDDEELAALTAVLMALAENDGGTGTTRRAPRAWARRHLVRGQFRPGPGAWRSGTH